LILSVAFSLPLLTHIVSRNQQVPRNETSWSPRDDYQGDDRQLSEQLEDDEVDEANNANDSEPPPTGTETLDGHPGLSFHTPSLDPGLLTFGDAIDDTAFFENRPGDNETETAEIHSTSSRYDDGPPVRGKQPILTIYSTASWS
jgi:hypothetical protein